jgi:hypothetical protein
MAMGVFDFKGAAFLETTHVTILRRSPRQRRA